MATAAPAQELAAGITCIDTLQLRAGLACCYLLGRAGEYALIESGTAPGVPGLLALLDARGIARRAVRYVIPTHAHLDHAGGAGVLMRELPAATLVAHPRALRHLLDPSKLIEGATAVYGAAAMREQYGAIVPVAADRARIAADGERIDLGGSALLFIDSPGHARHHFCIWDEASRGFFTGDTFGLSYRDFDGGLRPLVLPTTTPVQFEPEAWSATLERLLTFAPQRMYLTHYGAVGQVEELAADLLGALRRYVRIARAHAAAPDRHARIRAALADDAIAALQAVRCPVPEARARELLDFDMELNTQGLEVWLER